MTNPYCDALLSHSECIPDYNHAIEYDVGGGYMKALIKLIRSLFSGGSPAARPKTVAVSSTQRTQPAPVEKIIPGMKPPVTRHTIAHKIDRKLESERQRKDEAMRALLRDLDQAKKQSQHTPQGKKATR